MLKPEMNRIHEKLIEVSLALTAEKDYNQLLYKIVKEAMSITNADGGTLYLIKDDKLHHKIMQTTSMNFFKGGQGESINIEPLEMNLNHISSFSAL